MLYRVGQPSGVRSRLDVSAGRHTRFVGRQTELGVLRDAWEHVADGIGQTVLVQGEAGLGKSRLCYELRQQLAGERDTWLECRCSPYTAGTAFRPIVELVEQALAFQPADTSAEKLGKLGAGLARGGFAIDETAPLLAEWLELPENAGYTPLQAHGFPMFVGVARVCQGAARVAAGETAAIADIVAGLSIGAETGFQAGAPFLLNWLAEAYMIAGQLVEARNAVEMALAIAARTGQPGAHAELQRLQGEIALRMMDGPQAGSTRW